MSEPRWTAEQVGTALDSVVGNHITSAYCVGHNGKDPDGWCLCLEFRGDFFAALGATPPPLPGHSVATPTEAPPDPVSLLAEALREALEDARQVLVETGTPFGVDQAGRRDRAIIAIDRALGPLPPTRPSPTKRKPC